MNDRLAKLINLIKRTKEKVLVSVNGNPDDFYVILALKDYEKLLPAMSRAEWDNQADRNRLTEEELADTINRDIALWKSQEEEDDFSLSNDDFADSKDFSESEEDEETAWKNPWSEPQEKKAEEDFVEEERIEELIDDGFDSVADILANRQGLDAPEFEEKFEEEKETGDNSSKNSWSIPRDRKRQATKSDEEGQYLEEITF